MLVTANSTQNSSEDTQATWNCKLNTNFQRGYPSRFSTQPKIPATTLKLLLTYWKQNSSEDTPVTSYKLKTKFKQGSPEAWNCKLNTKFKWRYPSHFAQTQNKIPARIPHFSQTSSKTQVRTPQSLLTNFKQNSREDTPDAWNCKLNTKFQRGHPSCF